MFRQNGLMHFMKSTCCLFLTALLPLVRAEEDIRVGIIGLDTSHVTAFTETLNNPAAKDHVAGAKVVAACLM